MTNGLIKHIKWKSPLVHNGLNCPCDRRFALDSVKQKVFMKLMTENNTKNQISVILFKVIININIGMWHSCAFTWVNVVLKRKHCPCEYCYTVISVPKLNSQRFFVTFLSQIICFIDCKIVGNLAIVSVTKKVYLHE